MKSVLVLHTDGCSLSTITQSDIHILRQILDDTETQRFLPELCEEFPNIESLQKLVVSFDKYLAQDEGVLWGIYKDGTLIGFIAIMDIMTNPTLFYAMHPHYRNQGYAKEAVADVVIDFKKEHPIRALYTEVYKDNQASIAILQSCGFVVCGRENEKIMLTL